MCQQGGANLPILPSQRAPKLYMVPQGIRPVVQLTAVEVWFILKLTEYKYSHLILYIVSLCICFRKKKKHLIVRNTRDFFLLSVFDFLFFPLTFLEQPPWNILPVTFYYWKGFISSSLLFECHNKHIDISLTFAYIGFYFTDSGLGVAEHEKLPTGTCYVSKSHCGMWGWKGGICGDQKPQKDTKFSIFCSLHESCTLKKPICQLSITKSVIPYL